MEGKRKRGKNLFSSDLLDLICLFSIKQIPNYPQKASIPHSISDIFGNIQGINARVSSLLFKRAEFWTVILRDQLKQVYCNCSKLKALKGSDE